MGILGAETRNNRADVSHFARSNAEQTSRPQHALAAISLGRVRSR